MIHRLLLLKHWQLFVMFFIVPILIFLSYMFVLVSKEEQGRVFSDFNIFTIFVIMITLTLVFLLGVSYAWFWAIGFGLKRKIPRGIHYNFNLFKITTLFPVFYLISLPLIIYFLSIDLTNFTMRDPKLAAASYNLLLPLHCFSLFCSGYCIYFVAKIIKTIELRREPVLIEFIPEIFLILVQFVGIWKIQPKINQLAKQEDDF